VVELKVFKLSRFKAALVECKSHVYQVVAYGEVTIDGSTVMKLLVLSILVDHANQGDIHDEIIHCVGTKDYLTLEFVLLFWWGSLHSFPYWCIL